MAGHAGACSSLAAEPHPLELSRQAETFSSSAVKEISHHADERMNGTSCVQERVTYVVMIQKE